MRAADNLRAVEEKLREQKHRVQIQEPTTPRPSRAAAAQARGPGFPTPPTTLTQRNHPITFKITLNAQHPRNCAALISYTLH